MRWFLRWHFGTLKVGEPLKTTDRRTKVLVGNHDVESWREDCSASRVQRLLMSLFHFRRADGCYAKFIKTRMARIGMTPDDPDLDDQMYAVTYRGLRVVRRGPARQSFGALAAQHTKHCEETPRGYVRLLTSCHFNKLRDTPYALVRARANTGQSHGQLLSAEARCHAARERDVPPSRRFTPL